jgi:cytochrome bd-type quinol oxidase subunit 2
MDVKPQTVYIIAACVSTVAVIYAAWSWYRASKSTDANATKAKSPAMIVMAISAAALGFFIWLLMKDRKSASSGEVTGGLSLF